MVDSLLHHADYSWSGFSVCNFRNCNDCMHRRVRQLFQNCFYWNYNLFLTYKDIWPSSIKYRVHVLTGFAFAMFFLGLNLCTQSGLYWLDIMDNAAAGWALMLTGLFETIAVSWCYGVKNLVNDIEVRVFAKTSRFIQNFFYFRSRASLIQP